MHYCTFGSWAQRLALFQFLTFFWVNGGVEAAGSKGFDFTALAKNRSKSKSVSVWAYVFGTEFRATRAIFLGTGNGDA